MTGSQHFVPIADIDDNLIYLKDGSVSLVLSASAVNFGLLFETEQLALIDTFARLLNSLSFPIQIAINSKRLDVSSYLHTLDNALSLQTNPRLKALTAHYRQFVESNIKENNVLDKQFYVCLSVTSAELGILPQSASDKGQKAATVLMPRRDHVVSQLARLGLKSRQLNTVELIKLFYEIYNPPASKVVQAVQAPAEKSVVAVTAPVKTVLRMSRLAPVSPDVYRPTFAPPQPVALISSKAVPAGPLSVASLSPPFIVEELADDFGP